MLYSAAYHIFYEMKRNERNETETYIGINIQFHNLIQRSFHVADIQRQIQNALNIGSRLEASPE